ncbi:hypothetical protein [Cryptosporangium arvum]|uniref:Uncharacterized protein n=1 Tax=Cryptosporangium arvum DSM 44712 TaxID=927661 RepID=A0A011AED1_9ACTN|nr:hypothetical protein [Cryptosporangium arvum]EXG80396.1 hypothetical protein CryarDRAFT_1469 [Cryptosporangium arvum DSM 44712]
MAADFEYFVASPDRIASLDLGRSPASQLPSATAADLPGVDPALVLLALVEVLSTEEYEALLAKGPGEVVHDGGDAGPWVIAIDDFVVAAIQGADGDPEMEWDDAVALWSGLTELDEGTLLETTDELRRLCGHVDAEHRLYCWAKH